MQEKRKINFYTGQVIYIKNENDLIKQLINGQRGLFASSHHNIYGTSIKTPYVDPNLARPESATSYSSKET